MLYSLKILEGKMKMKRLSRIISIAAAGILSCSSFVVPTFAEGEASVDEGYAKAVELGIFTDNPETCELADAEVTKSEVIGILDDIVDWDWDIMAENQFTDLMVKPDGSYNTSINNYTDVLKAVGAGVVSADEEGYLGLWDPITREDLCALLDAALGADAASALDSTEGTITRTEFCQLLAALEDVEGVADYLANGPVNWIMDKSTEITVATVDTYSGDTSELLPDAFTYEGGWIDTDDEGNIITEATGTKDLNIRLWLPEGTQPGDKVPVFLYTFGGSWIRGTNASVEPTMVEYLVEHGIAVASLTYRYENEACFPYSLYDLQAQIRYLKINADELGIDGDNMGISGNSAGGYWCAELATSGNNAELQDPGYVTFEGDQLGMLTEINYCACQYGCFNMMTCGISDDWRIRNPLDSAHQHDRAVSNDPNVMGTYAVGITVPEIRAAYEELQAGNEIEDELLAMMVQRFIDGSPILQLDADDPCFFLYHGTADLLCPIAQSVEMYGALQALGIENNVMRICEGMGHGSSKLHPQYYLEMLEWCVDRSGVNA